MIVAFTMEGTAIQSSRQLYNSAGSSDFVKPTLCFNDIRKFVRDSSSESSSSSREAETTPNRVYSVSDTKSADSVLTEFATLFLKSSDERRKTESANLFLESSDQRRNVVMTLDLSPDASTESSKVGLWGIQAIVQIAEAGHFKHSTTLNLSQNRLQMDHGIMVLADSFTSAQWENLEVLGLSSNQLDNHGAQALAESIWCGALSKLRSLDLSLNCIGDAGIKSLAEAFKSGHLSNFQMLNLSLNKFRHEGVVALVEAFESGQFSTFRSLDLSGNAIGEAGANALVTSFISGHPISVHSLDLSGCELQDGGIMAFAELFQSTDLFQSVSDVCNVESLVLLDNVVESSALTALVASFLSGEWQTLKLQRGNKLQVERVERLAYVSESEFSTQSRALYLPQSNLEGDVMIMALMTTLDLASELALNSGFESLDLGGIEIGDSEAISLADSLRTGKWRNLRNLNLSRNKIGNNGLVALAEAFQTPHLAKLEFLGLAGNTINVLGAMAFAETCKRGQCHMNQYLVIDLTGNRIGNEALVQSFLLGNWRN